MKKGFDIKKWVRPNVLAMKPYASARSEFMSSGAEMILLDANENPFESGVNRYPDPQQQELKQVLAELKGVSPDQIFLGNGSDEILDLLFRAFCEPGKDAILTMPPTFGMFRVLAELNRVEQIEVPLSRAFTIDVSAVIEAVPANCKMILLCSPNNPTGNSFDPESVQSLLEAFEGIVVVDEAYIDFSPYNSWVARLDSYPNLVVTQTLSKAYGQAGIRLGMAYAQPEIIEVLLKIKLPYNVNILTQRWAMERIRQQDRIAAEIQTLLEEKERIYDLLERVSWVKEAFPSDANFILVRVDDGDLRYRKLLEKGIVVRNRSSQKHCENTLRISIGTPEENQILKNILLKV